MGLFSRSTSPIVVLSRRKDGSVLRGRRLPFAETLYVAGTPPIWGLAARPEPSERVARVRIDDVLSVERDERGWTVSDAAGVLGRARWRAGDDGKVYARTGAVIAYPDHGTLVVSQLLQRDGHVVDFGGVVTPTAGDG
ncbi:hypothetical protein [Cellulomonas sp. B6]|uniref:hypothetical protein n=1 Tax=Cellulomonas sp. B6 TaxID=1295626 RepID=UPI000AEB67D6|nr:hypothetical protein [Cellulomonas sp. B6]